MEGCPVVYYFNIVLCLTGCLLITVITYNDQLIDVYICILFGKLSRMHSAQDFM